MLVHLCPDGLAAGVDPGYPDHPNGTIIEEGYGVVDGQLRDASLHDYMWSRCLRGASTLRSSRG